MGLLEFEDDLYEAAFGANVEPDEPAVRVIFNSPCYPVTTLEFDLETGERTVLKREQVGLDYDPANYHCERVWALARDGERIPVCSMTRRVSIGCSFGAEVTPGRRETSTISFQISSGDLISGRQFR